MRRMRKGIDSEFKETANLKRQSVAHIRCLLKFAAEFFLDHFSRTGIASTVIVPAFSVSVLPVESSSQTFQYKS